MSSRLREIVNRRTLIPQPVLVALDARTWERPTAKASPPKPAKTSQIVRIDLYVL